jgi:superfamily II DNA helicase RecQ
MALTATATKTTYDAVCSQLSMKNQSIVGCAPNRDNIFYALKPLPNMDEFTDTISKNVETGIRVSKNCHLLPEIFRLFYSIPFSSKKLV